MSASQLKVELKTGDSVGETCWKLFWTHKSAKKLIKFMLVRIQICFDTYFGEMKETVKQNGIFFKSCLEGLVYIINQYNAFPFT